MAEVTQLKTAYKGKLHVEEADIRDEAVSFKKERLRREDAAAVLLLNRDTNKVILTRQFRFPIFDKTAEAVLEIVAGKLDQGEEPMAAAIRETEEETGYRIREGNIQLLMSCFSSPGYSSECFYIYYATVTDQDKVAKGGGLAEEQESIQVVEVDAQAFVTLVKEARLKDAKTCIAGLYFANYI